MTRHYAESMPPYVSHIKIKMRINRVNDLQIVLFAESVKTFIFATLEPSIYERNWWVFRSSSSQRSRRTSLHSRPSKAVSSRNPPSPVMLTLNQRNVTCINTGVTSFRWRQLRNAISKQDVISRSQDNQNQATSKDNSTIQILWYNMRIFQCRQVSSVRQSGHRMFSDQSALVTSSAV